MLYFRTPFENRLMNKISFIIAAAALCMTLSACKKTADYVPIPYTCVCGDLSWQGVSYPLLDANYILSDSVEWESRRYYITADVALEGETQTHSINTWIEIPDLDGGGTFQINQAQELNELTAWVDEFNLNDPIDSLRHYVPVQAVVKVTEAPLVGGTETVSFVIILNEYVDGNLVDIPVNYSGGFTVEVTD
jgi:hypothetical protein